MLILVPTRGRPQSIQSFMEAWDDASTQHADVMFCLDNDDEKLSEYIRNCTDIGANWAARERLRLGGTLNHYALKFADQYRYIGFMGDDHRVRTPGWDARLARELKVHGSGFVYGNDLLQGRNLPTAVVMSSDIISTLGYMVPAGLVHLYVDNAWKALGERAQCITYLDDVVVEHMHPAAGKAEMDAEYERVNSIPMYRDDGARWAAYFDRGLWDDVRKIQELRRNGG